MARHGTTHWDVAAYALGVLDPAEVARCEAHLAECPTCAAELEALLPATKLLADVDLETLREAEESHLASQLVEAVRTERHRSRNRRRLVGALGTVVAAAAAAAALFAGSTWLGSPAEEVATEPTSEVSPEVAPGVGGPDSGGGEEISAEDLDTGVQADVILETTDWGTMISYALSSLTGPLECHLLVVYVDGTTDQIGSWQVPEEGYGTPEHPAPLLLQAPTAAGRADLAELQVRSLGQDGSATTLVTVPL